MRGKEGSVILSVTTTRAQIYMHCLRQLTLLPFILFRVQSKRSSEAFNIHQRKSVCTLLIQIVTASLSWTACFRSRSVFNITWNKEMTTRHTSVLFQYFCMLSLSTQQKHVLYKSNRNRHSNSKCQQKHPKPQATLEVKGKLK